jgi:hypothetical protein
MYIPANIPAAKSGDRFHDDDKNESNGFAVNMHMGMVCHTRRAEVRKYSISESS